MPPSHLPPSPLPVPNPTKAFWHSEPDEFLLGHRTTEHLPKHARVVIVGSGITGANAGRWLVEDGNVREGEVVMLEAREACWGATGRNGGHLQPLLYHHAASIGDFELRNCSSVGEFIKKHNIECEYRQTSGCRTFWDQEGWKEAQDDVEKLREEDAEVAKHVSITSDRAQMEKAKVRPGCLGMTVTQGAASLWPYKLVAWMLRRLIKDGKLNLQTNTAVTKIEPVAPPAQASSERYPPRYKVYTPRGTITVHHLLLATNAYTSHLLPDFADIIVPVRETMTALLPPKSMTSILPYSYGFRALGQDPIAGEYLIQRPFGGKNRGHLMLGGGRISAAEMPSVGESDDSVIDRSVVSYLRKTLPPALDLGSSAEVPPELELDTAWTGIWAASRDGLPWVGCVPTHPKGLWLCAAYTGHGMPNATLCARAVVKMLIGEEKGLSQDEWVSDKDLPRSYMISGQRLESARKFSEIAVQDREGYVRRLEKL